MRAPLNGLSAAYLACNVPITGMRLAAHSIFNRPWSVRAGSATFWPLLLLVVAVTQFSLEKASGGWRPARAPAGAASRSRP